jgi:hypothetical protein
MKKVFFLILIIFFQNLFADKIAYFYCPSNWQIVNPKMYNDLIKISFVKKQKSFFRPSINLALEKTDLTLDEYTQAAKQNYMLDEKTTFTLLDEVTLKQGKANICKIDKNSSSIDFDLLQMIFIKDNIAYVMTAASKKNEMVEFYKTYMQSFLSFELIDDIYSLIEDKKKKEELVIYVNNFISQSKLLKEKQKQKKLQSFENYLDKKFENLGKYFTVLLLQTVYKNLKEI